MDAGFSSESNLQWLVNHHYDYITVMRSHGQQYTPASDIIEKVSDNKDQEIRLQKVMVEGCAGIVLLVDSDAKTIKERSMEEKAAARYEEGLKAIGKGIEGKGVKERDALQRRLGRLQSRYANASKAYNVTFEYDGKGRALSMAYTRNMEYAEEKSRMHGIGNIQCSRSQSRCDGKAKICSAPKGTTKKIRWLKMMGLHPIVCSMWVNLLDKLKILGFSRDEGGERYVKHFDGWQHLVVMLYAVIKRFDSLREISASMLSEVRKLAHLGISMMPRRSTLSDTNARQSRMCIRKDIPRPVCQLQG